MIYVGQCEKVATGNQYLFRDHVSHVNLNFLDIFLLVKWADNVLLRLWELNELMAMKNHHVSERVI